mgnify:CR=1 FL=1
MLNEYILRAKKFRTKKSLGQNFLISKDVIDEILNNVSESDNILEIGPGVGFVTEKLVQKAKKVVAVELDDDAINVLEKNLSEYKNFTLIKNDILKTDIPSLFSEEEKIKVIANIPYYITTPILVHLLGEIDDITHKTRNKITEIVLMVQFDPSPKVDSALVKFKINETPRVKITPNLKQTIKAAFSMRRKNIKNCLNAAGFINVVEALENCGISPNLRGENLSYEDFYKLSLELKREN